MSSLARLIGRQRRKKRARKPSQRNNLHEANQLLHFNACVKSGGICCLAQLQVALVPAKSAAPQIARYIKIPLY